jgi:hypothetical protein
MGYADHACPSEPVHPSPPAMTATIIRPVQFSAWTRVALPREDAVVEPEPLLLGPYLATWLRETVAGSVRPKTAVSYGSVVRTHLIPGLGEGPLDALRVADVQDADLHRAVGPRHRRARLSADGRHERALDLPGRVPPLRTGLDRADQQPRLRRLGPGSLPTRSSRARSSTGCCTTPRSSTSKASPIGCAPTSRQRAQLGRALLCSADLDRLCTFRGDLYAPFMLTHSVADVRRRPLEAQLSGRHCSWTCANVTFPVTFTHVLG